jgi:hypothetical protein
MDIDAARQKNDGKTGDGSVRKEHATAGADGVSRALDDRLAFKAASGCYNRIFCGTGPGVAGVAGLLACAAKAWGKARSDKYGARAMAGLDDWARVDRGGGSLERREYLGNIYPPSRNHTRACKMGK